MIDILLATYNGEKYLHSQIESIISQTFSDWQLIIHDDGSSDNTIQIITYFSNNYDNITFIEDHVVGLGPCYNFIHLLGFSNAEYVMFADQDDIWFESKVQTMFDLLQTRNQIPSLVVANSQIFLNNEIKNRLYKKKLYPRTLIQALFCNGGYQGCSMMFNQPLKQLIPSIPVGLAMHDHLITLTALSNGQVLFIEKPLMLYRRHESTVTKGQKKNSEIVIHNFKRRESFLNRKYIIATNLILKSLNSRRELIALNIFKKFTEGSFLLKIYILVRYSIKRHGSVFISLLKLVISKRIK